MTIQLKNNAVGFLSASVSATATLLVLQSGEGANFPALVPSQFFYVTLASASGATEIVKVTGRSGDSLTVQRGQENTTAMSFPALSRVELRVTAQAVYDVIDAAISGTTTAVSNIASVIAVAASIDSVNTVTSNLASVINVSNNIGDINLVENSLTNVNIVAANMADINAVSDDLAAVNAVADDIDDLVTNLEDIVAVGGSINSVVTVANNIASVNAVNSNSTNVNTVAGSIGNVNTVATNIAAVQTVSTNIASVNAVNSNSANVNTVAGSIANVNTTATNIASVNTAATNIVAIQTAPAQATAAANSASAAATSATNAANSASAAAASAVTAVNAPGTSGTSTTSLTIGTGSQTLTTQTGKAWVVGQFVTVASTASPTNFMYGQITAYNSGTGSMTVSVLSVGGSGTLASWTIGLGGPNSTLTDQNSLQPVALTLPSIRPSLLLDFANSKKLDPRITFSRATSGTYYDGVTSAKAEENLLLQSQVFLPAPWTLTDAEPTGTLGSELVTNGDFSSGSTGWTLDPNATVVAGQLVASGVGAYGSLCLRPVTLTSGKVYVVTYTIVSMSSGAIAAVFVTGANKSLTNRTSPGTYTEYFLSGGTANFAIQASVLGATATIDNISIKELTVTSVTAPDNTATATEFTADAANSTITQAVTAVAGDHTFSVWLRRVSGTGNIDITAHSGGTWVTQTITSTWARYTVTQTLTAGTRTPGIRIVTSGDQIEVWGAQLEQRSAATAYTPTTTQAITNYIPQLLTAPAGVPRFDHNPTTGESLGLLVEEQRTNLVLRSQEFDNAAWIKSDGAVVTNNAAIAPDGTLTADQLDFGSLSTSRIQQVVSGPLESKVYSIWAKVASGTENIRFGEATLESQFTLTTTWQRLPYTLTQTGANFNVMNSAAGGAKTIYIWGAQLEAGAFPTSYIPTTSASVTRTADDASMTGVNFSSWFNSAEGTLFVDIVPSTLTNGAGASINNNTSTFRINAVTANTSNQFTVVQNGVNQTLDAGTPVVNTNIKLAGAYKTNDLAASLNGGGVVTLGTAQLPTVVTQLQLGGETTTRATLTMKKFAYYPKRLTNAQLQALTA